MVDFRSWYDSMIHLKESMKVLRLFWELFSMCLCQFLRLECPILAIKKCTHSFEATGNSSGKLIAFISNELFEFDHVGEWKQSGHLKNQCTILVIHHSPQGLQDNVYLLITNYNVKWDLQSSELLLSKMMKRPKNQVTNFIASPRHQKLLVILIRLLTVLNLQR